MMNEKEGGLSSQTQTQHMIKSNQIKQLKSKNPNAQKLMLSRGLGQSARTLQRHQGEHEH